MAVYLYGDREIEGIIDATRRLRLGYCIVAGAVLAAAAVVAALRPMWIFGAHTQARPWVLAALFIFFVGPLFENLWRWSTHV